MATPSTPISITVVPDLTSSYPTVTITWEWGEITVIPYQNEQMEVSYKAGGGAWHVLDLYNYPQTSVNLAITENVSWLIRVRQERAGSYSDYLTADAINMQSGAGADTVILTPGGIEVASYVETGEETIFFSDTGKTAVTVPLEPDFHYYFGDYAGNVYLEGETYTSDNGTAIDCYWLSKQGDFADQDPECLDKFKYLARVVLWYTDIYANCSVTLGISADGGESWVTTGANLGNGDGTQKLKEFHFITTGHTLQFYIKNNTTTDILQWSAMEADYQILGDYFEMV